MSDTILLKLSIPGSGAYGKFASVEGLEDQQQKTQSLTFIDGEVHGLAFIRFLGGIKYSVPAQLKLEMINLDSVMAVWNFAEINLVDYSVSAEQESETFVKVRSFQFSAKLL
ncbi:hypothetical protein QWY86_17455 [Pedobacter aquatilis]|uniref:hypothetical protein n=1 Tax=Pedobacter aquatilis TaxID=351343 RepID=UPI0025B5A89B|nr:hypothetical protein [Pedobacter aquatilis]MDN3588474.1 hypothetical protein [Pedobacter aquatilis]